MQFYFKGGKDYLIGRTNNHEVDLNRNFPDLDAITFDFERQGLSHNNHLLKDLTQLSAPVRNHICIYCNNTFNARLEFY